MPSFDVLSSVALCLLDCWHFGSFFLLCVGACAGWPFSFARTHVYTTVYTYAYPLQAEPVISFGSLSSEKGAVSGMHKATLHDSTTESWGTSARRFRRLLLKRSTDVACHIDIKDVEELFPPILQTLTEVEQCVNEKKRLPIRHKEDALAQRWQRLVRKRMSRSDVLTELDCQRVDALLDFALQSSLPDGAMQFAGDPGACWRGESARCGDNADGELMAKATCRSSMAPALTPGSGEILVNKNTFGEYLHRRLF